MRPIITSFVDYNNASINEQIKIIDDLELEDISIRKVNGKPFNVVSDKDFKLLKNLANRKRVLVIDPQIERPALFDKEGLVKYETKLELVMLKAKELKTRHIVYEIPKFNNFSNDKNEIIELIKSHIKIIKKHKIDVLIKPSNDHIVHTYRLIFEAIKDNKVSFIFDPVYIYITKQAEVASYRILRDYIGTISVDDIDKLGASRLITTSNYIKLTDLFKRFIKRGFSGIVILDSGMIELVNRVQNYRKRDYLLSRQKRHERKIYNDYTIINEKTDTTFIIKIQLAILNLIFLNKKTQV